MGRVSVIVPVYNQESYLYKSLDSIINQSWNDLDIILVNDGSTDNSLRILYEYQEKDNSLYYCFLDSCKPSAAVIGCFCR